MRNPEILDQPPEEVVKEGFDKLLKVVQETARERVSKLEGQVQRALVEEMNEHDNSLVTGRLSNNTIVHFPGDASLIGKIVDVIVKDGNTIYIVEYHNNLIEGVGTFLGKDLELIEK